MDGTQSDGMLIVYLPAEKVVWSADISAVNPSPGQLPLLKAAAETLLTIVMDTSDIVGGCLAEPTVSGKVSLEFV